MRRVYAKHIQHVGAALRQPKFRWVLWVFGVLSSVLLLVVVLNLINARRTSAAWFDEGFLYRQKVEITNAGSAQTDFQVSITLNTSTLISDAKMQADCDDIRITDEKGNLLPHVIEEGTGPCNNSSTIIWTKVPSISTAGQTLYLYYGSATAMTAENGDAVFAFYDSFSTNTLNSSIWAATGATSFASGAITITTGSIYSRLPILTDSRDYIYEYRTKWDATTPSYAGMIINNTINGAGSNSESDKLIFMMSDAAVSLAQKGFAANGSAASYNLASNITLYTPTANTYYIDGYSMDNTEIKYWHNGAQTGSTVTGSWTGSPYMYLGFFTGSTASTTNITDMTVDWVRARKYAATAPSVGSPSNEERSRAPFLYWKLDEGADNRCENSGSSDVCDSMNQGVHGASSGGPSWLPDTECVFGKCLSFDGTDDLVSFGDPPGMEDWTEMSISAWVKGDDWVSTGFLNKHQAFVDNDGSWLMRTEADKSLYFQLMGATCSTVKIYLNGQLEAEGGTGGDYSTADGTTPLQEQAWYHVVGTATGCTDLGSDQTLALGYQEMDIAGTTPVNYFDGSIDEIKIYPYARTQAQVLADFVNGSSSIGSSAVLGSSDAAGTGNPPIGHWMLDENIGAFTADVSTSGFNGTLYNSPTWSTGKYGSSLEFDGVDDYVNAGTATSIGNLTSNVTVSAWVNLNSLTGDHKLLAPARTNSANGISFGTVGANVRFTTFGVKDYDTTTAPLTTGTWYHITAVMDANFDVKFYVNGLFIEEITHTAGANVNTDDELYIGSTTTSLGSALQSQFDGKVDDIRIYDYTRTAGQIVMDMNGGHPLGGSPISSMAGHWKFDEGADNTCSGGSNDVCNSGFGGSANDGTVVNMASPATATSGWSASGKINKALAFDGSNDYVNLGTALNFPNFPDYTVSVWIKDMGTGEYSDYGSKILDKTTVFHDWRLGVNSGGNIEFFTYESGGGDTLTTSGYDYRDSQWHHIALVKNGNNGVLYVDGKEVATGSNIKTVNSAGGLYVGYTPSTDPLQQRNFGGFIDELKIYSGSLSTEQVLIDYNSGAAINFGSGTTESSIFSGGTGTSPVSYWNFDENTGSVLIDRAGNANNGTLTGSPIRTPGKYGGGLTFTGANYVSVTDASTLDITGDFTISAWVSRTSGAGAQVVSKTNDSTSGGYAMLIGSQGEVYCRTNNGTSSNNSYTTLGAINVNSGWRHLTIVRSGTSCRVYVDGADRTNTAATHTTLTANALNLMIGTRPNTGGEFWNGDIDEVKIYDYARTRSQIAYDYNRGKPLLHYKLDECSGTTAHNSSPSASGSAEILPGRISIGATVPNTAPGTCTTSGAWFDGVVGKRNSSLDLDGVDDFIDLGDPQDGSLDMGLSDWSTSFWYKGTDTSGFFIAKANALPYWAVSVGSNSLRASLANTIGVTQVTGTSVFNDGNWHHGVVTWDRDGMMSIYIDGMLENQADISADVAVNIANANNASIGANCNPGCAVVANYMLGQIDDVMIYNYALTLDQVKQVYNNGAVFFGPATGTP